MLRVLYKGGCCSFYKWHPRGMEGAVVLLAAFVALTACMTEAHKVRKKLSWLIVSEELSSWSPSALCPCTASRWQEHKAGAGGALHFTINRRNGGGTRNKIPPKALPSTISFNQLQTSSWSFQNFPKSITSWGPSPQLVSILGNIS